MRNAVCKYLIKLYSKKPFAFITGDLGFMALEPLRDTMGERFINAGVAEQNMVSVAAGLANQGIEAWAYSIAPFCYARPFEQIRNDICLHDLPVRLVGNGGGYAYGAMGATHHALEDYGVLLTLQNMHIFVPAFSEDIKIIIPRMAALPHPAYLRLGRCEKPDGFILPEYAPWRRLTKGMGPVVLAVGPIVGSILAECEGLVEDVCPEVWVLSELPIVEDIIPDDFIDGLRRTRRLFIVEEHVAQGGVGQIMARLLLMRDIGLDSYEHVSAQGYPSGTYGSQYFHRKESCLDAQYLMKRILEE